MDLQDTGVFFSVPLSNLACSEVLPFDIYVNSSAREGKIKFIKIYAHGTLFLPEHLQHLQQLVGHAFIPEEQRQLYLHSLLKVRNIPDQQKVGVVKDVAVSYLENIFQQERPVTTEILAQTISGCQEVAQYMVEIIQDKKIDQLVDLIGNLSFHDFYTYDHSINVAIYCIFIYQKVHPHASSDLLSQVGLGGLLHDLGKIKIPVEIINWPDRLSAEQFSVICQHPHTGVTLLQQGNRLEKIDYGILEKMIGQHHENFNGTGYPQGLQHHEIHEMARIVAIADFFDAITTKRAYHDKLSVPEALAVMENTCGKKLDPQLFALFKQSVLEQRPMVHGILELPLDFDPCQPHRLLPFTKKKGPQQAAEQDEEPSQGYGKIKVLGGKKRRQAA